MRRGGRLTKAQYAANKTGVLPTKEFWRVWNLPRRFIGPESVSVEAMTAMLREPTGKYNLYFDQALALAEFAHVGGLTIVMEAGSGKSLVLFLCATMCQAERPMIICPPGTVDTLRREYDKWRAHFKISDRIRIRSYNELSSQKNRDMLFEQQPDFLGLDEAHALKNENSARTTRFYNFITETPTCRVLPATGTPFVRNLRECGPLLVLALRSRAPIPLARDELATWGDALGTDLSDDARVFPGALQLYGNYLTPEEFAECQGDPLTIARIGYGKRLAQTPGVIFSLSETLNTPITIRYPMIKIPQTIQDAFSMMRAGRTPDDEQDIADQAEISATARQLICGFFYRWVWPNNQKIKPWLDGRRAWYRFLRKMIYEIKQPGLDTNGLIENACKQHDLYTLAKRTSGLLTDDQMAWLEQQDMVDSPEYRNWCSVRHLYAPVNETVWIDDYLVCEVQQWLKENHGVAWVEHIAFGEALRARGVKYYGGGMNEVELEQESCAASIHAHYQGKNMQQFAKCLYVLPPTLGNIWEQSLARFHRRGQLADHIRADVFTLCSETYRAMQQGLKDAVFASQVTPQEQRLQRATFDGLLTEQQISELKATGDPLWA